ncbi:MAG: tetratricopeptide repeat protein [Myxococcota bacterium]
MTDSNSSGFSAMDSAEYARDTVARHMDRLLQEMQDELPAEGGVGPSELSRGQTLGRYVVVSHLGHGGMGAVFKAYDESLDRVVAIKLLHSQTTEEDTDRLRREAQALARLSHPNVVHVYEVTEAEGRWFIVMELVAGPTLRRWQQNHRSWRECVDTYLQLGRGLAAAHAAGLVHRDFKPDNCIIDETGRPRVLDFGLVGDLSDPDPDQTLEERLGWRSVAVELSLTSTGTVVGTPAYMPFEQMAGREIDARSDQFSFCVSLYEALYGHRPYQGSTFVDLMEEKFLEEFEERPPSKAVPSALHRALVRGLSAEPSHRWPSMDELLAELERLVARRSTKWWLTGLLLGAGSMSLGLARFAEFEARCDGADSEIAEVWTAAHEAEIGRRLAETNMEFASTMWTRELSPRLDAYAGEWVEQRRSACEATRIRQEQSVEVMDRRMGCLDGARREFGRTVDAVASADPSLLVKAHELVDELVPLSECEDTAALISDVDPPSPEQDGDVQALRDEIGLARLDRVAGRFVEARDRFESIDEGLDDDAYAPLLSEAALEKGILLGELGEYEDSEASLRRALRVATRVHHTRLMAEAATQLLFVVGYQRLQMEDGLRYADIALELTADNPGLEARARHHLGMVVKRMGDWERAERELRDSIRLGTEALGPEHYTTLSSRSDLVWVLLERGNHEGALEESLQLSAIQDEVLGPDHPGRALNMSNRGTVLRMMDRPDEAEHLHERALAISLKTLPPHHPQILAIRNSIANLHRSRGQFTLAERQYRAALELSEGAHGGNDVRSAFLHNNLGVTLMRMGRDEESEAEFRRALELKTAIYGEHHPMVAETAGNIAVLLMNSGEYAEAEPMMRRTLEIQQRNRRAGHPRIASAEMNLARVLIPLGRLEEAVNLAERALRETEGSSGPLSPTTSIARSIFIRVLTRQREFEQAERELRALLEADQANHGERHPQTLVDAARLARVVGEQGRHAEARAELERIMEIRVEDRGAEHPDVARSYLDLGRLLVSSGDGRQGSEFLEKAVEIFAAADDGSGDSLMEARIELASALLSRGRERRAHAAATEVWSKASDATRSPEARAEAAFLLARTTWRTARGRDERRQAIGLAEAALSSYSSAPERYHDEIREVRRWLASRA